MLTVAKISAYSWIAYIDFYFFKLQISEVRRQANMVKDQFSGYLNVMSDRVFDFSEDLLTKIAGHDSIFMSGQHVANQSTDTEVLENVHDIINQIQQNIDEGSSEKQFELAEVNLIKGIVIFKNP